MKSAESVCAFACFSILPLSLCALACGQPSEAIRSFRERISGRILVAGRLASEDGVALDGVRALVTTSYCVPGRLERRDVEERSVFDGGFVLDKSDAVSINIVFSKRGYFAETVHFTAYDKSEGRFGGFQADELNVVLRVRPEPASLVRVRGKLEASASGPTKMLQVSELGSARVDGAQDKQANSPELVLSSLLPNAKKIEASSYVASDGTRGLVPTGVRLTSTGVGDGFVVFRLSSAQRLPYLVFREMVKAPENGYESQIDFSKHLGDRVFFYCRIGGYYGKGWIGRPAFGNEERTLMVATADLLINPTGSRYVATNK